MLSRFKQNVRTYPRTAAVVVSLYLGAIVGSVIVGAVMHLSAGTELLTLAELVGLVAFVDFLTYLWVSADSTRLTIFLELLDRFEGRESNPSDDDGDCGPDCPVCNGEETPTDRDDLWNDEQGQDIAEYAVMLAVILVIVFGVIRAIGSSAGNVFSSVGSQIAGS